MDTFALILVGILGVVLGVTVCRQNFQVRLHEFVNRERFPQKERRKNMLLKHLRTYGQLNNEEAQELLGVSDSTIVNYFDELEEEERVRQVGETGRGVYYELT